MPRTLSANLQTHFEGGVLTLATCIKIVRKDGTSFYYTTYSSDLVIDGNTYKAKSGFQPTSIRTEIGTGVDNLQSQLMIDDTFITAQDINEKAYAGATVTIFKVNFKDLTQGKMIVFLGKMGEQTIKDGVFQCELLSLSALLKQTVGKTVAKTCPVFELGGADCKADLTTHTFTKTVDSVVDNAEFVLAADAAATGYYDNGTIEGVTGNNAGVKRVIKEHVLNAGKAELKLRMPFPHEVQVGDTYEVIKGCKRTVADCLTFDEVVTGDPNIKNFKGFPDVLGNDQFIKIGRSPRV